MAIYTGTSSSDNITGTIEDDLFLVSSGSDELDGADGVDTFDISGLTSGLTSGWFSFNGNGITFSYSHGSVELVNFEIILLTDFDDFFSTPHGTTYAHDIVVDGGGGSDFIRTGLGNDTLISGSGGYNYLSGLSGVDTYIGGEGLDRVSFLDFDRTTEGVHADIRTQTIYNDGHGRSRR